MKWKSKPPALASRRSPRWAFMEKFEIPNYDTDGNYLTRWRLIQCPLFGIYLHRFDAPDPRPILHDHPYGFVSVVLRGGYTELRQDPMTMERTPNRICRINRMRPWDRHFIAGLFRIPTWTLMFVGRRCRTWGYWELAGDWVDHRWTWTEFNKHPAADEFEAALKRREQANARGSR